mgnify:FL=1
MLDDMFVAYDDRCNMHKFTRVSDNLFQDLMTGEMHTILSTFGNFIMIDSEGNSFWRYEHEKQ